MFDRMLDNLRSSGLTDDYIARMGCQPATREEIAAATGVSLDSLDPDGGFSIPYPGVAKHDGSPYIRFRQFNGARKYIGPVGHDNEVYISPQFDVVLARTGYSFFCVVEGEKKAALLTQSGIPALGIGGVTSWPDPGHRIREKAEGKRLSEETLPHSTIRHYLEKCKCVIVIADSDYHTNPAVESGMSGLRASSARYQRSLHSGSYPDQKSIALLMATPPALRESPQESGDDPKPPELVKQGIDDYAVARMRHERETREHFDLADFNARFRSTIYLLAIAGTDMSDDHLTTLTAHAAYEQTCHVAGNYWHYDGRSGAWMRSEAKQEYNAPDAIHNTLVQARIEVNANYLPLLTRVEARAKKGKLPAAIERFLIVIQRLIKNANSATAAVESTPGKTRIITTLARLVEIPRIEFDRDPEVLAVENGVLDLRSRRLTPHSPHNLITAASPVHYDRFAECPTFLRFLESSLPSAAIRRYLQALIGYSATGHVDIQCFFVHMGPGGSGKGVLFETLKDILGKCYCVGDKSLIIKMRNEPHPANIAAIAGARCVLIPELDEQTHINPGSLKMLTGADTVPGRGMHENFYQIKPTWTINVATNALPHSSDTSEAAHRRFRIIPWEQKFGSNPDTKLPQKLKAEASGILNWILDGVEMYFAGELHPTRTPAEILAATNAMWDESDTLKQWAEYTCVRDPKAKGMDRHNLHASYVEYLTRYKYPVVGLNIFTRRLKSAGFVCRWSNGVPLADGIRFKNEAEKRYDAMSDDLEPVAPNPEPPHRPPMVETSNRLISSKIRRIA